jgi:predicted Zn-dependent peptidase
MINRKSSPVIHPVHNLILPYPEVIRLDNGIPVYVLDFPGQEIVKIEAVFRAGRPEESKPLASRATSRLMQEGTSRLTGAQIAELVDFYGGTLTAPSSLDTSTFQLFSLKKYAGELIPLFADVLLDPVFPETELDTFKRTSLQDLMVDLEKVDILAYRKVTELIFGSVHPYGYNSSPELYANLNREDLIAHYDAWYTPANCLIFASGRIDDAILQMLNNLLGQHRKSGKTPSFTPYASAEKPVRQDISYPGSLQSAIKIGRKTFNRHHPDFNGFFILNTILGGYFGSRLMMNIREKKGFTYNIYSTNDTYLHDGCFYISTEVNRDFAGPTLKEIWNEMKRLKTKPVSESELEMVQNYLLGMLLNGLDGPLNSSDVVKSLILEDLPLEAFNQLEDTIRTITPARIQDLANQYFQASDFWTVVAG